MPSGKLCRGVALRNERYCRAHILDHRLLERERQHDEAMFRLRAELDTMDIPELLHTLEARLNRITSIVRAYPEARLTLAATIDRLRDQKSQPRQPNRCDSIANLQHPDRYPDRYPDQSIPNPLEDALQDPLQALFNQINRITASHDRSNG